MSGPEPRRSLQLLDGEEARLRDHLAQLTPAELAQPSNLPGWRVEDLSVHVTRVCDSILLAIERAKLGDKTPAFGPTAKPREEEIRAMRPAGWVHLHEHDFGEIVRIVRRLTDDELERFTFPHPQGERPVSWFCTQLLAEVAFHRWDLETSLGGEGRLDDALAAYLLPFLLDPARPLVGPKKSSGEPRTFRLALDGAAWTLTSTADGTRVTAQDTGEGALISAPAGWLGLALYGRVAIQPPSFTVAGPADTAKQFAGVFGPTA